MFRIRPTKIIFKRGRIICYFDYLIKLVLANKYRLFGLFFDKLSLSETILFKQLNFKMDRAHFGD